MNKPAKKNSETVELESGTYTAVRLKLKDIRPLMKDGDMDGFAIAQIAVQKDGRPIGEALDDLYFDEVNKLLAAVNELNGLKSETGEEGNG